VGFQPKRGHGGARGRRLPGHGHRWDEFDKGEDDGWGEEEYEWNEDDVEENGIGVEGWDRDDMDLDDIRSRAPNYFHLLAIANETTSQPSSPPTPSMSLSDGALSPASSSHSHSRSHSRSMDGGAGRARRSQSRSGGGVFAKEGMAEGYFKAFFKEECKLGMGANGVVYLCQVCLNPYFFLYIMRPPLNVLLHTLQVPTFLVYHPLLILFHDYAHANSRSLIQHMLDGNPLGHFAVKKIAVGESHTYLMSILREVRFTTLLPSVFSWLP
jgi:hypothetical protein